MHYLPGQPWERPNQQRNDRTAADCHCESFRNHNGAQSLAGGSAVGGQPGPPPDAAGIRHRRGGAEALAVDLEKPVESENFGAGRAVGKVGTQRFLQGLRGHSLAQSFENPCLVFAMLTLHSHAFLFSSRVPPIRSISFFRARNSSGRTLASLIPETLAISLWLAPSA